MDPVATGLLCNANDVGEHCLRNALHVLSKRTVCTSKAFVHYGNLLFRPTFLISVSM